MQVAALALLAAPAPAAPRQRPEVPASCEQRMEAAREELIRRGFAPTTDKNTAAWLTVRRFDERSVSLGLEMRTSADGAATFYYLRVEARPSRAATSTRWRQHRGKFCCDEHAAREDRLYEFRWTRAGRGLRAQIQIVEFEELLRAASSVEQRDLFRTVAQAAADDCLAGLTRTQRP